MAEKRLFKEYKQLCKAPASANNPQILDLRPLNPEKSIFTWQAKIIKPSKQTCPYYYNGQWTLDIKADTQYPRKPPQIKFLRLTRINHPNINFETGEICLDILKDDSWSPAWNLEYLVGAICMLIDEPEPDSPLNVDLANLYRSDKLAFESIVQHTMWKENTLFEGKKRASGENQTHSASEYSSLDEEEKEVVDKRNHSDPPLFKSSAVPENPLGDVPKPKEDRNLTIETRTRVLVDPGLDYIHDMGRHITEEFLKKATEVQISSPRSPNINPSTSSHQLAAVHQHVSNNVARQIEQICLRSTSGVSSPTEEKTERKEVNSAKESFLEKIEQQVEEIRRLQERQTLA